MVALRSQGNWRWEGPLGTPLGLVHWKAGGGNWGGRPAGQRAEESLQWAGGQGQEGSGAGVTEPVRAPATSARGPLACARRLANLGLLSHNGVGLVPPLPPSPSRRQELHPLASLKVTARLV